MKIQSLALIALFTASLASAAEIRFTCTNGSSGSFEESLTVSGSGTSAMMHLEDQTLSGDLTYNAQMTAAGPQLQAPVGSLGFAGTLQLKTAPPSTEEGVFFVDPALANGNPGNLYRPTEEGFITFACRAE